MATAQEEFAQLMHDKEKHTAHPEDRDTDDRASFLDLSDSENETDRKRVAHDEDDNVSGASTSRSRTTIPTTRFGANTGPKGVISDAQNFRDSQRTHRSSAHGGMNNAARTTGRSEQKLWTDSEKYVEGTHGANGDEDGEQLRDSDFMQEWRSSRMKEMQGGQSDNRIHNKQRRSHAWGGLATVNGLGYLSAVDESPPDTVVVVYIYDDESEVSIYIEECVRTLAAKHPDVRFVRLDFADAEMEPAGVPALLAYQGGDKFAGLVPLLQEMEDEDELNASSLEVVLRKHRILR